MKAGPTVPPPIDPVALRAAMDDPMMTLLPDSRRVNYQAEVARRARMTPEELAKAGGSSLLSGLPWDQTDDGANVAVQTARHQRAMPAAIIEASNAVVVPPQVPLPQPQPDSVRGRRLIPNNARCS
jgi:hypothetical protein